MNYKMPKDSPSHIEVLRRSEGDERRYKGRCKYYEYKNNYCTYKCRKCTDCPHCIQYVRISEEEFLKKQKENTSKKPSGDDDVFWYD